MLKCVFCKITNLDSHEFHVDHNTISFSKIKNDFLETTKEKKPTLFTKDKIFLNTIFIKEDEKFEKEWVEYHNKIADYQILCCVCNLKKG